MDDYTWEKTIQRRRIRRRRQALLILVLLILALGAFFGWHSYAEKRTPEYALEQAAIAVQKKDADSFRHYVNLDLVTSRGYDDLTADLLSYDTTLTAVNKAAYEKFYITVKPQLTSGTQDTILRRVSSGEWSLPEGTDILKGRQLGIDYERFLARSQMRNTSLVGIGKVTRDGTAATAEIEVRDDWTGTSFTLEAAMEQATDGHWQVTYLKNYRDYLDARELLLASLQSRDDFLLDQCLKPRLLLGRECAGTRLAQCGKAGLVGGELLVVGGDDVLRRLAVLGDVLVV